MGHPVYFFIYKDVANFNKIIHIMFDKADGNNVLPVSYISHAYVLATEHISIQDV